MDIDSPIVKLLRLRDDTSLSKDDRGEIEKYYIHYIKAEYTLPELFAGKISNSFKCSNTNFRQAMYNEITDVYLLEHPYNPIMVVAGVRMRIEEIVCNKLDDKYYDEFIQQHRVIKKLEFAEKHGVNVPELYYLLLPMYNDGLHLNGDINEVQSKMKSCYLKTNNMHIRRMVEMLFK